MYFLLVRSLSFEIQQLSIHISFATQGVYLLVLLCRTEAIGVTYFCWCHLFSFFLMAMECVCKKILIIAVLEHSVLPTASQEKQTGFFVFYRM